MTTRVLSLFLAIMFLLSTIGFSAYVVWESNQDDNQVNQANLTTDANTATNTASNADNSNNNDNNQQEAEEAMLQGTKLDGFEPRSDRVQELEIIDVIAGDGDVVAEGATVTVHYTGALVSDGTIFQSSKDIGEPITFGLNGLIAGWQEGIPGMKVGGTRRLVIPADKAYGDQAQAGIPADSDLVFDIEMIGIAQ